MRAKLRTNIDKSNKSIFSGVTTSHRPEGAPKRTFIDQTERASDDGDRDGDKSFDFDKGNSDDEGIDGDEPEEKNDDDPGPEPLN